MSFLLEYTTISFEFYLSNFQKHSYYCLSDEDGFATSKKL